MNSSLAIPLFVIPRACAEFAEVSSEDSLLIRYFRESPRLRNLKKLKLAASHICEVTNFISLKKQ